MTFGKRLDGVIYKKRHAVYGIAMDREFKVLVIKLPHCYHLPGGGLEQGEDEQVCLKREFLEEIGYAVDIKAKLGDYIQFHYSAVDDVYYEMLGSYYLVSMSDKDHNITSLDHESKWINYEVAVSGMGLECLSYAVVESHKRLSSEDIKEV